MLEILRKQFFHALEKEVHQMGEMGIPTLIVAGRESKGIPIELSQKVHQIIKGSQLEIFDDAGHCPHDEHAEEFNQIALKFLGE